MSANIEVREILKNEYQLLGDLMVDVYSRLDGFPSIKEQPDYYQMLADIGSFNEKEATNVFVALTQSGELMGGVVYFSNMEKYGSGGSATGEKNASGIRLLGVAPEYRGYGVGKQLTNYCIQKAKKYGHKQVILHTTEAMNIAWSLYQKLGFKPSPDLDFYQKSLPVYGFRLVLK